MSDHPPSGNEGANLVAGYANYFEVGHNAYEFLIDFGQINPQGGTISINTRIAMGPTHAKLLTRLLSGSIREYEEQFGPIAELRDDDPLSRVLDISPDFERRASDARRRQNSAMRSDRITDPSDNR